MIHRTTTVSNPPVHTSARRPLSSRRLVAAAALMALATNGCHEAGQGPGEACAAFEPRCDTGLACDPCTLTCVEPGSVCAGADLAASCRVMCGGACCNGDEECAPVPALRCCRRVTGDDLPDDLFTDSNCDGIDGNASNAVFVDPDPMRGNDLTGDGSRLAPLATISAAIKRGRSQILVASGALTERAPLQLPAVIRGGYYGIFGGYDHDFRRAESNPRPVLHGASTAVLIARLTTDAVTWDRVDVIADSGKIPSEPSVAMQAVDTEALLAIHHARLSAGDGAPGSPGKSAAPTVDGPPGATPKGGCGCDPKMGCAADCAACVAAMATAPAACASGKAGTGGAGGACNGGAGAPGGGPAGGCAGGLCPGGVRDGGAGRVGTAGMPGSGGPPVGLFTAGGYQPAHGSDGSDGMGGSGGGGAAGTVYGACNPMACVNFLMTAPGGGGGGGGCGGLHGGGGGGGGASIGLMLVRSRPRLDGVAITTGLGGAGGAGGAGSPGGAGGLGVLSGKARGGDGGRGGDGAGGGGGGGGPSLCLGIGDGGIPSEDSPLDCVPGAGGIGGAGGGGSIPGDRGFPGATGRGL